MQKKPTAIHRYPGIQPFSKLYKDVFFGRIDDVVQLLKYLNVSQLVVLHGKSGLGKSSLLNAGLIPKMEAESPTRSLFVRFGGYNPQAMSPKAVFVKKIKEQLGDSGDAFLQQLNSKGQAASTWQYMKALEWSVREQEKLVLILDQFEEVFTYPDRIVEEFARDFSELVHNRMPEHFRKSLYQQIERSPEFMEKHGTEVDFIEHSPTFKIVIAIRSDRLSLMDRLSGFIPNILRNCYELLPLTVEQARLAIAKPAEKKDGESTFTSPPFQYDEGLLQSMLHFLSKGGVQNVEPFLLQIICQHIEDSVESEYGRGAEGVITIDRSFVGNLESIARNYYAQVIRGKDKLSGKERFTPHEQLLVRHLIEAHLIDSLHLHRVSLDRSFVYQTGVNETMLTKLVNARILRQEPNSVSGMSYELSHDTLIEPIIQSAQVLGPLNEVVEKHYRQNTNQARQQFIEKHLLNEDGQRKRLTEQAEDRAILKDLEKAGIVHRLEEGDEYELYSPFLTPAVKVRSQEEKQQLEEEKQKGRRLAAIVSYSTALLLILAIVAYLFYLERQDALEARSEAETARDSAEAARQLALQAKMQSDSLNQELLAALEESDSLRRLQLQPEFTLNRARDIERKTIVPQLYDSRESTRKSAMNQLLFTYRDDPDLVENVVTHYQQLVKEGKNIPDDGTIRTIILLNSLDKKYIRAQKELVQPFLEQISKSNWGNNTQGRIRSLRSKLS